jgi:ppGpp synthetase/RelA/SpoT-type nucleotidyltranferase
MNAKPLQSWIRELHKRLLAHGQKEAAGELMRKVAWRKKYGSEMTHIPFAVWQAFFLVPVLHTPVSLPVSFVPSAVQGIARKSHVFLQSSSAIKHLRILSPKNKHDTITILTILLLITWDSTSDHPVFTKNISLDEWRALADTFGMWRIRYLMEDMRLKKEDPEQYETIQTLVQKQEKARKKIFSDITSVLRIALNEAKLQDVQIEFRKKNIAGIAEKMKRKGKSFNQITDIFGYRIITNTIPECYKVEKVLCRLWREYPEHAVDFIKDPKPNGYRSLHKTVQCIGGIAVEFQIRTRSMDWVAKYGPAAHLLYKASLHNRS